MKLRQYQQEGFDEIIETLDTTDSPVMFVLATGGGKTVTFMQVIKHYLKENYNIILIAHREELITQAYKTFKRNNIFSGIIKADYPRREEFNTQICSIQTIIRRKTPPTDLIIVDEGHHVTKDNSYGKIFARYPNAKILMVTATPTRLDKKGFTNLINQRQTKLIVNRTTKQLIDDGFLVPFKYFVSSLPDLDKVKVVRGDYDSHEAYEAMKLAPIVESYMENASGKKGICYAVNVKHSKEIAAQFQKNGINAVHLDATTPQDERDAVIQGFRTGSVQIVVNVGILTEGADFPDCQFVQLASPTMSLSKYLQMVGRVTRPAVAVDKYTTSKERRQAIALSHKSCGIVLDNSKCWKEHGFPDQDFNWNPYFIGEKQKKKVDLGMIEIYEIEDPVTGERQKTRSLKETVGSILVEVSYEERIILAKDRKNFRTEFNKLYYLSKRLKHVKKKGFFVWFQMKDLLLKKLIEPSPEVFNLIRQKLIDEPIYWAEKDGTRPSDNPLKIPTVYFENQVREVLEELNVHLDID